MPADSHDPARDAELARHRATIDALDREILERLNARARTAQAIGELKAGGVAYRPEREAQVLRRLQAENPRAAVEGGASPRVFREMMSACLALEQPLRIAYLGPAGTFSHAAVAKHFGAVGRRRALRDDRRGVPRGRGRADRLRRRAGRELDRGRGRAARSTSCARRRCDLRRGPAAHPAEPAADRGVARRGDARSTRTRSRWRSACSGSRTTCPACRASPSPATPRRRASRRPSRAPAAIAGEIAAAIYGLDVLAPHIEDEPQQHDALLGAGQPGGAAARARTRPRW